MTTRVLYVTSRFPSITTTFVANEMTAVQAAGCDVHVAPLWDSLEGHAGHEVEKPFLSKVTRFAQRSPATWLDVAKAIKRRPSVLGLIAKLVPGHLKSPWLFAKLVVSIPRGLYFGVWAAENDVDRLHAHFLTTPTTVAMIAAEVAGIPFTATAHAFDITSEDPRAMNGSVALKCLAAESIVTISEYNVADILRRWPELDDIDLQVIYNGIDTTMFSPESADAPFEGAEPFSVLSVSRLTAKKGHEYLIRAIAQLRDDGVNVRLDIYGDGELKDELTDLIRSLDCDGHITLHGAVSQSVVREACERADIFSLACVHLESGDADGLPTVIIEALAVGRPTVSTQVTGVPEIVVDGETGLCVPERDAAALADAINWMIENPIDAREMGQAGRKLVETQFDRAGAAQRLLELWA